MFELLQTLGHVVVVEEVALVLELFCYNLIVDVLVQFLAIGRGARVVRKAAAVLTVAFEVCPSVRLHILDAL